MVIQPSNFNASVVCWRVNRGVIEVLVLDSTPTTEIPNRQVQVKFPGGGSLPSEGYEETARREFREETGLIVRRKTPMVPIYSRRSAGEHWKTGFLVERKGCKGKLLKTPIREEDSIIGNRRWVPIDEAVSLVYRTQRNPTQHDLVLYAKIKLEELGVLPQSQRAS